jgi:hypothetical protein
MIMEGFPPELEALLRQFTAFLPQMVRAIVLLIAGALLGLLLETVGATMLRNLGFDGFAEKAGVTRVLRDASRGKDQRASTLAGNLIFWIVMLTFMGMAGEILGLSVFGEMMTALAAFLPRLLGAALLLVLGLFLAQAARELMAGPTEREVTPPWRRQLDRGAQAVIVALTMIVALSLVGVDLRWVTWLVVILIAVAGLAIALAFGGWLLPAGSTEGRSTPARGRSGGPSPATDLAVPGVADHRWPADLALQPGPQTGFCPDRIG